MYICQHCNAPTAYIWPFPAELQKAIRAWSFQNFGNFFMAVQRQQAAFCTSCGPIPYENVGARTIDAPTPAERVRRAILGRPIQHGGGQVVVPMLVLLRSDSMVPPGSRIWGLAQIEVVLDTGLASFPKHTGYWQDLGTTQRITALTIHSTDWMETWISLVDGEGLIVMGIE